jgi:hypothetical protein
MKTGLSANIEERAMTKYIVANAKAVIDLISKALIPLFLLMLFFSPGVIGDRIQAIGISKILLPGGFEVDVQKANDSIKEGGARVADLNYNLPDVQAALKAVAGDVGNTKLQQSLQDVITSMDPLIKDAADADNALQGGMLTQERALVNAGGSIRSGPVTGWIYAGQVNADKTAWISGTLHTIGAATPKFEVNDTVTVTNRVYVHEKAITPGQRSDGNLIGVVNANTDATILAAPLMNRSLSGGWFVWLKVQTTGDERGS